MHPDHKKQMETAYDLVTRPVGTVVKKTLESRGVLPSFEEKVEGIVLKILQKHGLLPPEWLREAPIRRSPLY
jgi:hypothetical protein